MCIRDSGIILHLLFPCIDLLEKVLIALILSSAMDKVSQLFDSWASNGRAKLMEKEHGKNVKKFLDGICFGGSFSFLDVGCGNGWVVRKMAQRSECRNATGIDKSKNMIKYAKKMRSGAKEEYICADIESLRVRRRFDYIFAMESIYYSESIETALEKIFSLLKPGGEFFCGTDFYSDNKATSNWSKMTGLAMHLHSKKEWRELFSNAGFQVRTRQIKDKQDRKKWKREFGTLFIVGKKPETVPVNSAGT